MLCVVLCVFYVIYMRTRCHSEGSTPSAHISFKANDIDIKIKEAIERDFLF